MFKEIDKIDEHAKLYIDDKTGIAVIRDGSTGLGHSCHSNIDKSGSVRGMKNLGYWKKDAKTVRAGSYIYNISSFVIDKDNKYDLICAERCQCEMCLVRRQDKDQKEVSVKSYLINNRKDVLSSDDRFSCQAESEKMIVALKIIGYEDFDYDEPFHAKNKDMSFSDLKDLYVQKIAKKLLLGKKYNIQKETLTINTHYGKDDEGDPFLSVLASFSTQDGDNLFVLARNHPYNPELIHLAEAYTASLISADECKMKTTDFGEQWAYQGENIWEYDVFKPRHEILELSEKDKLSSLEIDNIISYYERSNLGSKEVLNDRNIAVIKQMIADGFSNDRIALIGKNWDAKNILKSPEIKKFKQVLKTKAVKSVQTK